MSMRKHIAALAFLSVLATPVAANAAATITLGSAPTDIADDNSFTADLNSLGLTKFSADVADIVLDPNSAILFYFLGSESAYDDTFSTVSAPALSFTETTDFTNAFAAPVFLGGALFGPGSLTNLLNFSSNLGTDATIGNTGFGLFLSDSFVSGSSVNEFVFAYDDQITNPDDDNHDDLIFRAVVTSVPEPATWAMMLLGFGAVGAMMRRKRPATRAALATA
jgi:hypothetical protein